MKKKNVLIMTGIAGVVSLAIAGNLQPAARPMSSAMRTLQEIYQAVTRRPGHVSAAEGRWMAAMVVRDVAGPWDLPWQEDAFGVIDIRHNLSMIPDPNRSDTIVAKPGVFLILREIDAGSPVFLDMAFRQQSITEVVLYFFQRPGSVNYEDVYLKMTLGEVRIVRQGEKVVHCKGGQFAHLEELQLLPTKITVESLKKEPEK